MSSFTGAFEHYAPWKTIDGREVVTNKPALEVLVKGVFDQHRFLDLLQNFVLFSDEANGLVKRVAKYHQYWAVNAAVESTVEAAGPDGDRRGGVVWHTQGSGKSIEMLLYAAKIMRDPRMGNPTLVFITDRNDLDDQLFGEVFAPAEILPEKPVQADSRSELRTLLRRASGGIVFTTLQKFAPEASGDVNAVLTDRRNVVVVADEAHRSQYGFAEALDAEGRLTSGLAKHMRDALPNATYLGFTGTPIESTDKSTRAVFGEYIDVYDLTRAVEDGATVRIFYESRLAKVSLDEDASESLDDVIEEISENAEAGRRHPRQVQVGAARGDRRCQSAARHRRGRPRRALGGAPQRAVRQGHDRGHEPAHRRRALQPHRRAAPGLAQRRPRSRPDQGRHDRLGRRSARVPAAHLPEGRPQEAQAASEGPGRSAGDRHRPRHVAHRLRRPGHAHHVRRQADAGCRADAGHRAGQPHLPRQARRPDRRLHRRGHQPAPSARRVLTERPRPGRRADRGHGRRDAGEARHRARPAARLRLRLVPVACRRPNGWRSTRPCSTS